MKAILLDTHVAIWFFNGSTNLSETAKQAILIPSNQVNVSVISVWEIAVKINAGKLTFSRGVAGFLELLDNNGFQLLNIASSHLLELERLPLYHRDPFDRLLIATAIAEGMDFITADGDIRSMPFNACGETWLCSEAQDGDGGCVTRRRRQACRRGKLRREFPCVKLFCSGWASDA
jgi:PIN domain nuclease of toxin-antitoxin system